MQHAISATIPPEGQVNYYFPLAREEVAILLARAQELFNQEQRDVKNVQEIASIQIRLGQGIPGLIVPYDVEGPVTNKLNELCKHFIDGLENHTGLTQMADTIMQIYQE